MTSKNVPPRSEIAEKYKWNAESVFSTPADWEAELAILPQAVEAVTRHRGRLAEGPAVLLTGVQAIETLMKKLMKLYFYANMAFSVDTTDQAAAKRNGQIQSAAAQGFAAVSFLNPELLQIGEPHPQAVDGPRTGISDSGSPGGRPLPPAGSCALCRSRRTAWPGC